MGHIQVVKHLSGAEDLHVVGGRMPGKAHVFPALIEHLYDLTHNSCLLSVSVESSVQCQKSGGQRLRVKSAVSG
jgi:hypothetical protein